MYPEDIDIKGCRLLLEIFRFSSLSLAAASLSIGSSAASKRLEHMRQYFGDKLFVRTGGRMLPTERMIELAPRMQMLVRMGAALRTPEAVFSPESVSDVFRIAAVDNAALMCFHKAFLEMTRKAPNLTFEFENLEHDTLDRLRAGVLDLGLFGHRGKELPPAFHDVLLMRTRHVLLVDRRHPLVSLAKKRALVPGDLVPYRRIGITMNRPTGGHLHGIVDRLGTQADYALRIPHFLAGALLLEGTDFVATLPQPLAARLARAGDFAVLPDPIDGTVPWVPSMVWHERTHESPLHQWVRSQILYAVSKHTQGTIAGWEERKLPIT